MVRQWLGYAARDPLGAAAFAGKLFGSARVPIVSASIGRVGSTLLYEALIQGRLRAMFGRFDPAMRQLVASSCWDLENLSRYPAAIYKTHDVPPARKPALRNCKIVFLYGRPSDVVISLFKARDTKPPGWLAQHLAHMHATGPFDDILDRDILRMETHLTAWPRYRDAETLCMRYETLWQRLPELERFIGFSITLPPRAERTSSNVDRAIIEKARQTYAGLDRLADELPDSRA